MFLFTGLNVVKCLSPSKSVQVSWKLAAAIFEIIFSYQLIFNLYVFHMLERFKTYWYASGRHTMFCWVEIGNTGRDTVHIYMYRLVMCLKYNFFLQWVFCSSLDGYPGGHPSSFCKILQLRKGRNKIYKLNLRVIVNSLMDPIEIVCIFSIDTGRISLCALVTPWYNAW